MSSGETKAEFASGDGPRASPVPLRLPEPAHTREFHAFLERVPKIADSLAVDPVLAMSVALLELSSGCIVS